MPELDRLLFSRVRDAYPDRWEKGRPGNALVNPHDDEPGRYLVRRQGSDEWHECVLVVAHGEFFGTCDCRGDTMHDGACSHLCAVYRLHADDRDHWHQPRIESIHVPLESAGERQAQLHAEPDARSTATDGGMRL